MINFTTATSRCAELLAEGTYSLMAASLIASIETGINPLLIQQAYPWDHAARSINENLGMDEALNIYGGDSGWIPIPNDAAIPSMTALADGCYVWREMNSKNQACRAKITGPQQASQPGPIQATHYFDDFSQMLRDYQNG